MAAPVEMLNNSIAVREMRENRTGWTKTGQLPCFIFSLRVEREIPSIFAAFVRLLPTDASTLLICADSTSFNEDISVLTPVTAAGSVR